MLVWTSGQAFCRHMEVSAFILRFEGLILFFGKLYLRFEGLVPK